MSTNRNPVARRRDDAYPRRSRLQLKVRTATGKRYTNRLVMLCSLLAAASVLAIATTSCARIPCAGGYADPNWCEHGGGGGGGESGG